MWRSNTAEEWQRRKTYLIRSLFEDVPVLSPIQEEQEPESSFNDDFRPDSPLPDLIIEKAPKKRILCDEPDEFYVKLAKKMRRLYKRDHYCMSDSTYNLDSLKTFDENEYIEPQLSSSSTKSVNSTQELNTVNKSDNNKIEFREVKENDNIIEERHLSSNDSGSSDSDSNFYSEEIETQVEVYSNKNQESHENLVHIEICDKSAGTKDADELKSRRCIQNVTPPQIDNIPVEESNEIISYIEDCHQISDSTFKTCTTNLEFIRHEIVVDANEIEKEQSEKEARENEEKEKSEEAESEIEKESGKEKEEEEFECLAISSDASRSRSENSEASRCSPEIMRQVHRFTSIDSLDNEISKSDSDVLVNETFDIHSMRIEESIISYGPKEATETTNCSNTFLSTSTPKSTRKSRIFTRKYRKRLTSYSTSSISCKSVSVQASFPEDDSSDPDDGITTPTFWSQLFVGTPTFYNVCSCRNHVCS